jgi:predicted  nucleic acid-binding Zn-ribbon protein
MNWDTAPQELESLRAQVAALKDQLATMTKERDRWQEDSMRQAATINRMSAATEDRNEVDQLRHAEHEKELAAMTKERDRWQEAYERCNTVCGATEECWNADLATLTKVADAAKELIAYSDTGGDDKPYPYIFWDDKFKALEIALKGVEK